MLEKLTKKLHLSSGMINVGKISSGTMLGQILSFITLPFYTRIYGAEVIGNWALFTSIATIVNSFSDAGLSNAIMIEDTDEDALRVYKVISTIVLIVSLITAVGCFGFYTIFPDESGIESWFIALTLLVLVITSQQSQLCYTWLNRNLEYDALMKNPVINQVAIAVVALPLGFLGFIKYGYYIGLIIGQICTILHMKRFLPREMFTFKISDFKHVFKTRQVFLRYQLPTNLMSNVKNQLPTLLIKSLYGSEILGYYSVSVKILNVPINLLANAIGRVYFQTASSMAKRNENIGDYTLRNLKKAMKIAIIPLIGMMAFGDIAMVIFLGSDYDVAGNIFRIVVMQSFFTFLMMSSQGVTVILEKQKYAMASSISQMIGYTLGLMAGEYIFGNFYIGIAFMSATYILIQIIYFSALFKAMKMSPKSYLKSVAGSIAIILIATLVIRGLLLAVGIVETI